MAFAYDRESETFVVSQAKNNWGKTFLPSLSFRIRDAVCTYKRKGSSAVVINTSAVEWGSESAVSVDEILGQGRDGRSLKPSPKTDECRKWLVGILNSPVGEGRLSSNIVTVGSELDYSKPLIYKVAKELGVFMEEAPKDLVRGGRGRPPVLWSLPEKVRLNDLVGINAYILITTNYILINIA